MRILIFGAGAIGSLLGAYLWKSGNSVSLIGRRAHMEAIEQGGLRIVEPVDRGSSFTAYPNTSLSIRPRDSHPDLVIVTVKAYSTTQACREVKARFSHHIPPILLLQNGIGVEDEARRVLPESTLLRGVTSHGAAITSPGVVAHTGRGGTTIGLHRDSGEELAERISGALTTAGIESSLTPNINGAVWSKTLVNAALNPFGALTGMRNGELLEHAELMSMMKATIREGEKVAKASGVKLSPSNPVRMLLETAKATRKNKNSMLQDLEKRRKTEIDYINGAIADLGRKLLREVPLNALLTHLVKAIEGRVRNGTRT